MNKNRQIFLHVILWTAIFLFFLFANSNNGIIKYESIVIFIYFGVLNTGIFYINGLLILPKYLRMRKYRNYAGVIILLILISGFIKYGLAYCFKEIVLIRGEQKGYITFPLYYLLSVITSTFFILLSTAYRFLTDWFINEKLINDRENEKLTVELAFLKSHINPHFLLNSLNNIYSLAYQKSEKTPEAVLKLSEIMRYMLYESNDTKVELSQEIRYLRNYIELQKIRIKGNVFVEMNISGDDQHQTIVPFILIPFVENAFKHGIATEAACPIIIQIHIRQGKLQFKISNKKSMQNKDETGGIDLKNVKRRLDLLYPGKYKLNIEDNTSSYTCELFLDL